jgi:uncharacterized membrane protein
MVKFKDTDMQSLLGNVLRAGTVISISVVFFGGVIYLIRHGHSVAGYTSFKGVPAFVQHSDGLINGAIHLKGQAIIQLGIIMLIATPILRVVISAVGFVLEKDYFYVAISILVLLIIFISMLGGHAG